MLKEPHIAEFIAPDEKPRHLCRGCKSLMRSINIT